MLRKWIVILVIVLVLGWVFYDYFDREQTEKEGSDQDNTVEMVEDDEVSSTEGLENIGLERGKVAPDFTLETLQGEMISLSDFRGEKVLLNFWASWCPPCHAEMPDLTRFHESYDDAVIVSVNVTETEKSLDDVHEFLDEYDASFVVLLDETLRVSNLYGAHQLPTTYLIDSEGKVHNMAIGPVTYDMLIEEFYKMK